MAPAPESGQLAHPTGWARRSISATSSGMRAYIHAVHMLWSSARICRDAPSPYKCRPGQTHEFDDTQMYSAAEGDAYRLVGDLLAGLARKYQTLAEGPLSATAPLQAVATRNLDGVHRSTEELRTRPTLNTISDGGLHGEALSPALRTHTSGADEVPVIELEPVHASRPYERSTRSVLGSTDEFSRVEELAQAGAHLSDTGTRAPPRCTAPRHAAPPRHTMLRM